VVLYGGRDEDVVAGDERLDRELFADEAFLDDPVVPVAVAHVLDGLGLRHLVAGDADAFAAGEADGFDGDVAVVLADVLAGGVDVLLDVGRDFAVLTESALTAIGFAVIVYSLYAD